MTYRVCRYGSSGRGCSRAGPCRAAGGAARRGRAGPGTWRRGRRRAAGRAVRGSRARTRRRRRLHRQAPAPAAATDRRAGAARRPTPAGDAARASGTSHADDGVTRRAAVPATRHIHYDATLLAACRHSTAIHPPPSCVRVRAVRRAPSRGPRCDTPAHRFLPCTIAFTWNRKSLPPTLIMCVFFSVHILWFSCNYFSIITK